MKEREKCKKLAITDLNAPNGSRDIPFQIQEFEQDECCHFSRFSASFSVKYDVTDVILKDNKNTKVIYLRSHLICLKLCRLLGLSKEISLHLKFRCHGNQNQNDYL